MKKNIKSALTMSALVILVCLGLYYGKHYLSLGTLQQKAMYLRELVSTHYISSLIVYSVMYSVIVIIGIPTIGPLTMLGGFIFGALATILCALIAIAVGMTLSFLIIRSFFLPKLRIKFAHQQTQFASRMQKYGSTYLLTLNILTVIPFFVINALAALTGVSLWSLLWTSLVGSTPMLIIYACAGKKFAEINRVSDIFSPSIIIMFIILVALSIIPLIIKRLRYR
ncbi:MAG TPA: VTT domain-containing protein [Candidatus Babeliales bacterium]|jgi:uncharacterized membrane protein YdjX (TVP38/TMEM64 family)|nr:VTT domain-containing protein [Candidatus Babeliales bacterium]